MRRLPETLGLLFLLVLPACSNIWAQALSQQMTTALLSLESYRGELQQHGLLPERPDTAVVQELVYAKPWRIRAEVTAPADLKGDLFIFDGSQLIMWWPNDLLGMRIRGLVTPDRSQVAAHVAREMAHAMDHYAFSRRADAEPVAGHDSTVWRVLPLDPDAPLRMHHTSWNYERYALPLKMEFRDNDRRWYGFEFSRLEFDVPIADDAFSFRFPQNALVLEWDMQAPGITLDEARRTMNFSLAEAGWLPPGHSLKKVVRSTSCLPLVALQYDNGASVLTLTESRAWSADQLPRYGKEIAIGDATGRLQFAGPYSVLTWIRGDALLTLTSNLSFPQVVAVARSVR